MIIDSNFKDYYDSVKSLGVDKAVVYSRYQKAIIDKKLPRLSSHTHGKFSFHHKVLGFCGKLYPFVEVVCEGFKHVFYSKKELDIFRKSIGASRYNWYADDDMLYQGHTKSKIGHFSNDYKPHLEPIFQQYKCPVFLFEESKKNAQEHVVLNPKLKNYGFYTIKDTFSAFQDIYMYISGVLGVQQRPTVKLTDKEMAKKRGHDGKYSFKKTPTKKKK